MRTITKDPFVRIGYGVLLVVSFLVTGCTHSATVGLHRALTPPKSLRVDKVPIDPRERKKAQIYYNNHKLVKKNLFHAKYYGNTTAVSRAGKIYTKGGYERVFWKEIMDVGGKSEQADKLYKRVSSNVNFARAFFLTGFLGSLASVGVFSYALVSSLEPNAPSATATFAFAGSLAAVSIMSFVAQAVFQGRAARALPKRWTVDEAAQEYNRKLRDVLGLSRIKVGVGTRATESHASNGKKTFHLKKRVAPFSFRCLQPQGHSLSKAKLRSFSKRIYTNFLECHQQTNRELNNLNVKIKTTLSLNAQKTLQSGAVSYMKINQKNVPSLKACLRKKLQPKASAPSSSNLFGKWFCTFKAKISTNK